MTFQFKLPKNQLKGFKKIRYRNDKVTLKINADFGEQRTFAIATSKKDLNHLKKTEADIIYCERKGKLYFNANGIEKGWGTKNVGGLIAKVKGKPVLFSDSVKGFKVYSDETFFTGTADDGSSEGGTDILVPEEIVDDSNDLSKPEEIIDELEPITESDESDDSNDSSDPVEIVDESEPLVVIEDEIQAFTIIESKGNTELLADSDGFAWISSKSNNIQPSYSPGLLSVETPFGSYMAAETLKNKNYVVYSNRPPFVYIDILKFDKNWKYIEAISHDDGTDSYYKAEVDFDVDFNADGILGSPLAGFSDFTIIEENGNAKLLEDEDGSAWVAVGSNLFSLISEDKPVKIFNEFGFFSAVETLNGINYIVYSYDDGFEYQVDVIEMGDDWDWIDIPATSLPNDGRDPYYINELDFGVDFNADGILGSPGENQDFIVIEGNGNTELLQDENGFAWISFESNKIKLSDGLGSSFLVETPFGSYMAAETLKNKNYVVYSNSPPFVYIDILKFDKNWKYIETISHDDGTDSYYKAEVDFGVDFNADGVTGSKEVIDDQTSGDELLEVVESDGNAFLLQDKSGFAWVATSDYAGYLTISADDESKKLKVSNGFLILCAEEIDGKNYGVLTDKNDPGDDILILEFDNVWNYSSESNMLLPTFLTESIPDDGNYAYYSAESDFNFDFNSDGLIGLPKTNVEQVGNAHVFTDEKGRVNIESGSKSFVLNYRGNTQFNRPNKEWNVVAGETWKGVNYVADLNKSRNMLVIHKVDKDWNFTGDKCEYHKISIDSWQIVSAEAAFKMDFNDDGIVANTKSFSCSSCMDFKPNDRTLVTSTCITKQKSSSCIFSICSYTSGNQANNNWKTYEKLMFPDINII